MFIQRYASDHQRSKNSFELQRSSFRKANSGVFVCLIYSSDKPRSKAQVRVRVRVQVRAQERAPEIAKERAKASSRELK